VVVRLFFWQVVNSAELKERASDQHFSTLDIPSCRGRVFSSDGMVMATNQEKYLVYGLMDKLKSNPGKIARKLAPVILSEDPYLEMTIEEATKSGVKVEKPKEERLEDLEDYIEKRLKLEDLSWVMIWPSVDKKTKKEIEKMEIAGIGFEVIEERYYPEASTSAHVLGFVGKDVAGEAKGYFGIEGYYNRELTGRDGKLIEEKDALGRPILIGSYLKQKPTDGADLYLTIDAGVQKILEENLKDGVEEFDAKGGVILVMEPTGRVVGMYGLPVYSLWHWQKFESDLYKNPGVAKVYEPGSIMKPLVMAAAINEKKVKPETKCLDCDGPRYIGGFKIETFDQNYYPGSTMTEVLIHSDNTGMVWVGETLGAEKMYKYFDKYGFGELTGIEVQEEEEGSLRDLSDWREIDVATSSFGQGVAVTPIQILTAFGTIANDGYLYRPYMVEKIKDEERQILKDPERKERVLKGSTSQVIKEMMVKVCEESPLDFPRRRYKILDKFKIAAKSGTAQIPVEGKYTKDRTIASVIGFFPADEPKYLVLVSLFEPKTDIWGANTAGPVFFETVSDLVKYFGISP